MLTESELSSLDLNILYTQTNWGAVGEPEFLTKLALVVCELLGKKAVDIFPPMGKKGVIESFEPTGEGFWMKPLKSSYSSQEF